MRSQCSPSSLAADVMAFDVNAKHSFQTLDSTLECRRHVRRLSTLHTTAVFELDSIRRHKNAASSEKALLMLCNEANTYSFTRSQLWMINVREAEVLMTNSTGHCQKPLLYSRGLFFSLSHSRNECQVNGVDYGWEKGFSSPFSQS